MLNQLHQMHNPRLNTKPNSKNAGDYYQDLEAYDDALEAYAESLRVMTAFYGRDHVFLSEALNEIGVTRFKSGEYRIAKQSFTEVRKVGTLHDFTYMGV